MYSHFYTATAGASMQQSKMNVLANNMANLNTTGYKAKAPVFADLMYDNYTDAQAGHLQTGNGVKLDKTTNDFTTSGSLVPTSGSLDFAIVGDGFFAVQDMDGEEIKYTRDGRFMISNLEDTMYLTNALGQLVLNTEGDVIEMDELTKDASLEELNIGVYNIPIKDGMISDGYNNYTLTEKNGEPEVLETINLRRGYLESSNADMANEMSQVIEAQRAYSFALKMIQTSDEVEQEVNSLRR